MTASIEWLNTLNISENFKQVKKLTEQLKNELDPKYFTAMNSGSDERQSLITNFLCPKVDGPKVVLDLFAHGFTCCLRNEGLRIAPSIYNDSAQISEFTRVANRSAGNHHN
jgi:selenocysteine lyase/cysteine desulfurase